MNHEHSIRDEARLPPPSPRDALSLDEIMRLDALGIRCISGAFLYRQYRYELLEDAVAYAELERGKIGQPSEVNMRPAWVPVPAPTNGDWRIMKELGITFDGSLYQLLNYRYTQFQDAINQARFLQTKQWGEERPANKFF